LNDPIIHLENACGIEKRSLLRQQPDKTCNPVAVNDTVKRYSMRSPELPAAGPASKNGNGRTAGRSATADRVDAVSIEAGTARRRMLAPGQDRLDKRHEKRRQLLVLRIRYGIIAPFDRNSRIKNALYWRHCKIPRNCNPT
jgi:hypothetical protein